MKSTSSTSTSPLSIHQIASFFVVLFSFLTVGYADDNEQGVITQAPPPVIEPPSQEFCAENQLGDQMYPISVFQACTFKFYATTSTPSSSSSDSPPYSCPVSGEIDDSTLISTQYRQVVGWPDVCIANGPRCYSIADNPSLVNFTLYSDAMVNALQDLTDDETVKQDIDLSQYKMEFPDGASVVSVDCSGDFQRAQQFAQDFPQIAEEVGRGLTYLSIVLLVCVLLCVGTACACLATCFNSAGKHSKSHYIAVPSTDYVGPAVKARKYEGTTSKV